MDVRRFVVVGRPNVGKTLFVLNFAGFLGLRQLEVIFREPDERLYLRRYQLGEALAELVDPEPHSTRCLQSVLVDLPAGKGKTQVELLDTAGLNNGIHPIPAIRRAIAQTLGVLREVDGILHVLDAAAIGRGEEEPGELDREVARFGRLRPAYAILANKMDLPEAGKGLAQLRREFPGQYIIPVSALRQEGFREVRRYVAEQR
ncbi:MAG: 50S ribosome-binding GTPase [Bacillota bacterium]|nr:50S ribosome-binding GTPase [Bacillota bacterium]